MADRPFHQIPVERAENRAKSFMILVAFGGLRHSV
jgi:hypothetical protein